MSFSSLFFFYSRGEQELHLIRIVKAQPNPWKPNWLDTFCIHPSPCPCKTNSHILWNKVRWIQIQATSDHTHLSPLRCQFQTHILPLTSWICWQSSRAGASDCCRFLSKGLTTQGISGEKDAGERGILENKQKGMFCCQQKELENEKHFKGGGCARPASKASTAEKVLSRLRKSRFKAVGNVKRSMCIYYSQAESAEPTRQRRAEWAAGLSGQTDRHILMNN